jgi:Terminase RNaseH-like domain
VRALSAFTVRAAPESGDKLTRFGPFSSQCRAGNVKIRRGSWNEELFRVLEGFPDLAHDDQVGAWSGVLKMLNPQMKSWGLYELIRRQAEELEQQREPEPRKTQWAPARSKQAEQDKMKSGSIPATPAETL